MIVRVTLKSADFGGDRIRFDLSLDSENRPRRAYAYFGFYGALGNTELSSGVLLKPDGVIDMGYGFEGRGRFHKTNLLSKRIELGSYVTIWWAWHSEPEEATYVIENVLDLSSVNDVGTEAEKSSSHIETLRGLPRFRARVVKSFNIEGFDGRVYRPPVGVEGDVAYFQDQCVFCPDGAVASNGQLITAIVDLDNLQLVVESDDPEWC